jgi:Chaperone for flagella basal body P-ring formation
MRRISPILLAGFLFCACTDLMASPCRQGGANAGSIVVRTYYDAATRQQWEVRIDCRRPERPASIVPVSGPVPAAEKTESRADEDVLPVVKEGSAVQLWRDGNVRIQLSGIAIEPARLNHPVRVRTPAQGVILWGLVRGPGSVELIGNIQSWSTP